MLREDDLDRIRLALERAERILAELPAVLPATRKAGGDPVTAADLALDQALRAQLPSAGEGWLSEESPDGPERLSARRVWVVDPLDGTRQFVHGDPEWSVSIGLVEDGRPVAGGVLAPALGVRVLGAEGLGVRCEGVTPAERAETLEVLASRAEWNRGEWDRHRDGQFRIRVVGSIALKLAYVAAGCADATWTLTAKHEWDVAAGTALVLASGGEVWLPDGAARRFNQADPRLPGLVAARAAAVAPVRAYLQDVARAPFA